MLSTSRTVVAVFDDHASAERAVADLVSEGFSRSAIDITTNDRIATDSALGNTGLSGQQPRDTSGGGISGFFRRMFGADDEYSTHYEQAIQRGGVLVSVTTDDEDRASDILERNGAIDVEERAASWNNTTSGAETTRASNLASDVRSDNLTNDHAIPVVREELHVGKRDVRRGGIRVYNRMEERPVEEQVQLREEHVRVDRRPANRPATEADFRAQGEVIEVTEMAEEAVIGKSARVVEEVVVNKETTQRTETIRDTLRNTDVTVENLSGRDNYDDDFRQHFRTNYGNTSGATYETYDPAYRYGYTMASDDRYRGSRWEDVETRLRTDYEGRYPNSKWEQMKDSVRYGWEKVTGRR